MTLYKQVDGKQVPLSDEEAKVLKLAWESERERQLTEELQFREKCYAGEPYRLFDLLWEGISEGTIPGKDSSFYSCIAEAKKRAETEILEETGLTKEEFDAAIAAIIKNTTEGEKL